MLPQLGRGVRTGFERPDPRVAPGALERRQGETSQPAGDEAPTIVIASNEHGAGRAAGVAAAFEAR